jgi:hypothetical protein
MASPPKIEQGDRMTYENFKHAIHHELRGSRRGLTWAELKARLGLPYAIPCPTWTKRLEQEIGLSRAPGTGRAYVWSVAPAKRRSAKRAK